MDVPTDFAEDRWWNARSGLDWVKGRVRHQIDLVGVTHKG
jgi:hypothetical protein